MNAKTALEIFGYIGSALVVISMLMSSIVKLRIINSIGSFISFVYALLCGAKPLALMNICLIIINLYGLYKLLRSKKAYELVKGTGEESFVRYFLERYGDDIRKFFPDFRKEEAAGQKAFLTCCGDEPAGLMLGDEKGGTLDILVDYTTPKYRDSSVAKYLYEKMEEESISELRFSRNASTVHLLFLKRMGFEKQEDHYFRKI